MAEGVEGSAELAFLAEERCDEVQGRLLGGPSDIGLFRHITHRPASDAAGKPILRVVGQ
jgi:EAL domain-containing protein (putative c-di-GMP-specific phosphodiesterase class I)